ncbi:MAG TPA: hypothetical protein VIK61_15275 [Acidimicrobiia bacterium]
MGFLKDINTLKKQAKEIDKTFDPGAQMRAGKERMAAAQEMLAQQTAAAQLVTTGETAEAQVVAARDTGTQINLQPVLEIDLLVMRQGQPPYPATVRQLVANAQLGLVAPGAMISVRIDPANPSTVLLGI